VTTEADLLAGRLRLAPGTDTPVCCERPMVGATLMRRLAEGRHAALLPELVGAVFSLCPTAQRSTSRRAIAAAFGHAQEAPLARELDHLLLAMSTAREHLQRFALDLPRLVPLPGIDVDPGWLRDAPVVALPARADGAAATPLREAAAALPSWLERRLLGMSPASWLRGWRAEPAAWLTEWARGSKHPLAAWLAAVRADALRLRMPCRALRLLDEGDSGPRELAAALGVDPDLAEHPLWHGLPAETGPWTRRFRPEPVADDFSVWHRLGSRLADLAALAEGEPLATGALCLAPGEGIAWSEMSRGLLLHWVRLEGSPRQPDSARVAAYRVFAPTEWNFHPQGALAQALRRGAMDAEDTRLAALALDPCITFDIVEQHDA
jgi:hypothetical protein